VLNDAEENPHGRYVLYWMTAARRTRWNFALERAAGRAHDLRRPLLVLEALRAGYPYASDRLHRFVLEGMRDNAAALDGRDPNSCTGILWCLGRHDRSWGPERPIFGTVRYMSSENTARKFNVQPYLRRYGPEG
jgi:deoxyribodipyrimidine photolyase